MKLPLIIIFVLLILALIYSKGYKEGFAEMDCAANTDCTACTLSNGCSWCPKTKKCLRSSMLLNTNKDCNPSNVFSVSFRCDAPPLPQEKDSIRDDPLYRDQVADRVRPPNAYSNPQMEYSNETVMANVSDVRRDVTRLNDLLLKQANWFPAPKN
jgi:hypothetical protein